MNTKILQYETNSAEATMLSVDALRQGELIIFPTETVYGIGADLFNKTSVQKIFDLKQRSAGKPLAAMVSSLKQVEGLCSDIPDAFYVLAEEFLPGPLTIILKVKTNSHKTIPDIVCGGMNTLGIRFPDCEPILRIIDEFGSPIASTSANFSGNPSFTNVNGLINNFDGLVKVIVDGGETKYGKESTVLSLVGAQIEILRVGVIDEASIRSALKRHGIN